MEMEFAVDMDKDLIKLFMLEINWFQVDNLDHLK